MFEHNFHPRTSPQHHSRTQKLPSTVYHNSIRSAHFRRWEKWNPSIHPAIHLSIAHRHPLVNFSQRWLGTWISKLPYGVLGVSSGVAFQTEDPAVRHPEFERCPEMFLGGQNQVRIPEMVRLLGDVLSFFLLGDLLWGSPRIEIQDCRLILIADWMDGYSDIELDDV